MVAGQPGGGSGLGKGRCEPGIDIGKDVAEESARKGVNVAICRGLAEAPLCGEP